MTSDDNERATGTRDFEGYKDNAARLQVLYKPTANFSALFNVHGRDMDGARFRIEPGVNEVALSIAFEPALDGFYT